MTVPTRVVSVSLGPRSYAIEIGAGNLADAGDLLGRRLQVAHAVIVTDTHVEDPHAHAVAVSLHDAGAQVDLVVVEPGERTKSVEVAGELWEKMLELGVDRKTVLAAVGGGVVGDLAGFVAATYARGIPLLQVATTLLAMVDSSVGGKVGVNLPSAKNMVGSFWQPAGVIIDIEVLETLPAREYRAGLAEVVKYGVILDAEFFAWLEANVGAINGRQPDALVHLIARCCELKAQVVERDEREETGLRAVLNYGHTFCHALESLTGYEQLLHGEAVAIGMQCAARLAQRLGRVDAAFTHRQRELLVALGLEVALPPLDHGEILTAMVRDKKAEQGQLRFVLPMRMGEVELVGGIDPADVLAALGEAAG